MTFRLDSHLYSGLGADDQHITLQGFGIQPIYCIIMIDKFKKHIRLKRLDVNHAIILR